MIKTDNILKHVALEDSLIKILNGVTMTIAKGDSAAIVGASGSGKTTLLSILAGLDLPSSGSVWLDDQEITSLNEDQRAQVRAELVGFIFQSFQLLPALNALENVMLPLELAGRSKPDENATDWLNKVGLSSRLKHYPRQLSGGEQQRVAVARAFASQPKILFADEPTGNLDKKTGQQIADLLFELNNELNTTLVLVTHDELLAQRCQHQYHIEDGLIGKL